MIFQPTGMRDVAGSIRASGVYFWVRNEQLNLPFYTKSVTFRNSVNYLICRIAGMKGLVTLVQTLCK